MDSLFLFLGHARVQGTERLSGRSCPVPIRGRRPLALLHSRSCRSSNLPSPPFRIFSSAGLLVMRHFLLLPENVTFILKGHFCGVPPSRVVAPFSPRVSVCSLPTVPVAVGKSSLGSYYRSLQGNLSFFFVFKFSLCLRLWAVSLLLWGAKLFGFSSCSGSSFPGGSVGPSYRCIPAETPDPHFI